jgi:ABC-type Fe3+ transport system substrate-binding protein
MAMTASWVISWFRNAVIAIAQRDFNTSLFRKSIHPRLHQIFVLGVVDPSPADVFLTENSPSMVLVDNAKLFAPLDAATLQPAPS